MFIKSRIQAPSVTLSSIQRPDTNLSSVDVDGWSEQTTQQPQVSLCWHQRQSWPPHIQTGRPYWVPPFHSIRTHEDFITLKMKLFTWIQWKRYKTSQRQNNWIVHAVFRMPMHSKEYLGIQYLYKEAILPFSPNNLYFVLFFETRSHVCQAGLKLYTQDGLKLVTLPP